MTPPTVEDDNITYFAATHTRGKHTAFGIRAKDRAKHMYVIGKTGMGKSTMLENMAIQDIQNGEGLAFIDPHGSTAEKLLDFVPKERMKDVLYFAPFDTDFPVGFNVMEDVGYDKRHLVVAGLMGTFKRIWEDAWSARMEYILENTLLALLEYPDTTLLDVNRMLINKAFREEVTKHITDPVVKSFWAEEFAGYSDRYTQDATPAIQNKIGQFTSNPLIRNIVGQPRSSFDMRKIMDERKILIVNLSKGRMGEKNASLLGSMLVVKIYLSAMSRADEPESIQRRLPPFYFYVDEFQSVVNEAFADILSEARKYKLCLTIAHQYIEQMEENVRNAVFGNIGTLITFRVGSFDAEVLKTEFEPTFTVEDLVSLGVGNIYLKLMIDGVGSAPFSADTIPAIEPPSYSYKSEIIQLSRRTFAKRRESVEVAVIKRHEGFAGADKERKKQESGGFKPARPAAGAPRDDKQSGRAERTPEAGAQKHPPKASRAPADVLRARTDAPGAAQTKTSGAEEQRSGQSAGSSRGKQEQEHKNRSALKDAINTATRGLDSAHKGAHEQPEAAEVPAPARTPRDDAVGGRTESAAQSANIASRNEHHQSGRPAAAGSEPNDPVSPETLREFLEDNDTR